MLSDREELWVKKQVMAEMIAEKKQKSQLDKNCICGHPQSDHLDGIGECNICCEHACYGFSSKNKGRNK
jgi:hypothetical protein